MDQKRSSRERRRLTNTNNSSDLNESINNLEDNFNNTSVSLSKSSSTPEKKSKRRRKKSLSSDQSSKHNDVTHANNFNEISIAEEYIRRSSISPEGADENSSDCDIIPSSKVKESGAILHKREKRRKSKRQRESKRTSTSGKDDEEDINENRSSLSHQINENQRRQRLHSSSSSLKHDHRKVKKKSGSVDKQLSKSRYDNELPITEILRETKDNLRIEYEEAVSFPQLTTDRIYVQGRNGFSAVKIPAERGHRDPELEGNTTMNPIKVAILAQKAWKNVGFIYQGLLAGMAIMHLILIHTYYKFFEESIEDYFLISEIYTNVFSLFSIMSMISVLDKFDLAHFELDHFRKICTNSAKALVVVPLYVTVFCLHQVTMKFDDKLSLISYNRNDSGSIEVNQLTLKENNTLNFTRDELNNWRIMTLTKDGLAVLAWVFTCFTSRDDMLLTYLQALEKYAQNDGC